MAKPELGTKRQCQNCGSKFYDLQKDPIICPKCGTVFQAMAAPVRGARAAAVVEEEVEADPIVAAAVLVPLEEADAADEDKTLAVADDIEIEDEGTTEDDTFLEPEEDENDDVADLIDGDIGEDEES